MSSAFNLGPEGADELAVPKRRPRLQTLPWRFRMLAIRPDMIVSGWLDDVVMRRLLRNMGHLISGRAVTAVLGVATLAVIARTLGPAPLGALVMIEGYARVIQQIVRPETWQALVKYGSDALEQNRPAGFEQLLKFGGLVDLAGSCAAGAVVLFTAPLVGQWLDWSGDTVQLAQVYSIAVIFRIASTPIAVLRMFNRFSYLAWLDAVVSLLRLTLASAAWLAGGGLWTVLLLMISAELAHCLILVGLAWRELRRHGHGGFLRARLRGVARHNRHLWGFIVTSNASVLIRKSTQEFDVLIVGAIIGPAAVGVYHIAKRVGDALFRSGTLLQQAAFPDLARLWARREVERFRRTVLKVSLATAAFAAGALLVVTLKAGLVVQAVAGPGFEGAELPLIVQMVAASLALIGVTLRPALLSMGHHGALLVWATVTAVAFYVSILLALPHLGIVGASLAHAICYAVWLPALIWLFWRGTRGKPSP